MREILAERVRVIREESGATQERVADAARAIGLEWSRHSVTTLELGRRDVSVDELALLPAILARACGRAVTLADLIPVGAEVRVGPTVLTGAELLAVLGGQPPPEIEAAAPPGESLWGKTPQEMAALARAEGWPALTPEQVIFDAASRPVREAEVKAARALSRSLGWAVTPQLVAMASETLWSRPLDEQRDAAAAEAGMPEARRGQQALRGHVTRRLLRQLEDVIKNLGPDQPRGAGRGQQRGAHGEAEETHPE